MQVICANTLYVNTVTWHQMPYKITLKFAFCFYQYPQTLLHYYEQCPWLDPQPSTCVNFVAGHSIHLLHRSTSAGTGRWCIGWCCGVVRITPLMNRVGTHVLRDACRHLGNMRLVRLNYHSGACCIDIALGNVRNPWASVVATTPPWNTESNRKNTQNNYQPEPYRSKHKLGISYW